MATSSASYVPQKENTLADIVNRDRAQENQSSEKSSIVSGNPTSWGFPSPRSAAQRESTPSHEYDEDAENRDPDVGIDIHIDEDAMSVADIFEDESHSQRSSVPSEYPSTQRAWVDVEEGFRVHEDGDGGLGVGN